MCARYTFSPASSLIELLFKSEEESVNKGAEVLQNDFCGRTKDFWEVQ
jgi:hypothetical protein